MHIFPICMFIYCLVYRKIKSVKQKGEGCMKTIGNILWFILCGLWSSVVWFLLGCFLCITIIGIPLGKQCFKFAGLSLWPFGKDIVFGGGAVHLLANILWLLFVGWEMAIGYVVSGLILCITIIGIPFGSQCFKLAKLALMPFGATVV